MIHLEHSTIQSTNILFLTSSCRFNLHKVTQILNTMFRKSIENIWRKGKNGNRDFFIFSNILKSFKTKYYLFLHTNFYLQMLQTLTIQGLSFSMLSYPIYLLLQQSRLLLKYRLILQNSRQGVQTWM